METVPLKWVANHIAPSAYAWARNGRLPIVEVDGMKCVPKDVVIQLEEDINDTCSIATASRLIGTSKGSMRYLIDTVKVVKTKVVFGHERVLRDSIEPAKKYRSSFPERKSEQSRRAASSPRAKLLAILRRGFGSFVVGTFEDKRIYIPRAEAKKILGVSYGVMKNWCDNKTLREKKIRNLRYIESASMRNLQSRMRSRMKAWRIEL